MYNVVAMHHENEDEGTVHRGQDRGQPLVWSQRVITCGYIFAIFLKFPQTATIKRNTVKYICCT
jgi:hypothetical protein